MSGFLAVFFITLGLGQLISTGMGLRGAALVNSSRLLGYGVGLFLVVVGGLILPQAWPVLWWTLLAGPLTVLLLLWGSAYIDPPPHPNHFFAPTHPAHGGCQAVNIPDGNDRIPGFLLSPPKNSLTFERKVDRPAVCIIHGAGAHKTFFLWSLAQALLAQGLAVLIIDLPGHGDYRHRLLAYPDCLSVTSAALQFLRQQPGVSRVGLIGISMGGALVLNSLAENSTARANTDAVAIIEMPVRLLHTRQQLFYRELWRTLTGPVLSSLLREASVKQAWQIWHSGGRRSQHTLDELFALFDPLKHIARLSDLPLLLVYSRADTVAPPEMAAALRQAAPQADFIEEKKASHVLLTLTPKINRQIATWLWQQLAHQ